MNRNSELETKEGEKRNTGQERERRKRNIRKEFRGFIPIRIFFLGLFLTAEVFLNHSGFLDHIQLKHTVGILWTSDEPVAEASIYTTQHINTRDKHPCPQRDSNPPPQQLSCRRHTP
jgi:hypothetical protein